MLEKSSGIATSTRLDPDQKSNARMSASDIIRTVCMPAGCGYAYQARADLYRCFVIKRTPDIVAKLTEGGFGCEKANIRGQGNGILYYDLKFIRKE